MYTKAEYHSPSFKNPASLPQRFSTTDFESCLVCFEVIGRRQMFITATEANSAKLTFSIFGIFNSTAQDLLNVTHSSYGLSFQPKPTAIIPEAKSQGV